MVIHDPLQNGIYYTIWGVHQVHAHFECIVCGASEVHRCTLHRCTLDDSSTLEDCPNNLWQQQIIDWVFSCGEKQLLLNERMIKKNSVCSPAMLSLLLVFFLLYFIYICWPWNANRYKQNTPTKQSRCRIQNTK